MRMTTALYEEQQVHHGLWSGDIYRACGLFRLGQCKVRAGEAGEAKEVRGTKADPGAGYPCES